MFKIIIFCLSIMYTPGPVNLLSISRGIQQKYTAHIPFCIGVGGALLFWFMLTGYAGTAVISKSFLPVLTFFGVLFILYLAFKLMSSKVDNISEGQPATDLKMRDGFLMQLLNPKSFMVVLPVTTVQFPAAGITGWTIALWSVMLAVLGFGAPLVYAVFGEGISKHIERISWFKYLNIIMGIMLLFLAIDMAYEDIFLVLK
jgi:threonine/homoserine/homoserine lactone efflux protein